MSTTRLMILGLVKWLQPVHGYHVRRELVSWNVAKWANIQPGSIYHALRKLTTDGLLEEVATEQVGARPARTTYRMTPAGEREFAQLLRRYWWDYEELIDPFMPAFSFITMLPRRETVAALRNRAKVLADRIAQARSALSVPPDHGDYKPPHVAWMVELGLARYETEIAWCERVAERIEAGEGFHADEVDLAEMGRTWRAGLTVEYGEPDNLE